MKRYLVVFLLIAGLGLTVVLAWGTYSERWPGKDAYISDNILYLTSPVTIFPGRIEALDGNTITVSREVMMQQPLVAPATNPVTPAPTAQPKKLAYRVRVSPSTTISRWVSPVPYLFKVTTPSQPKRLSVRELKVGEFIDVTTNVDLRTLRGNEIQAAMVNVRPLQTAITGTIVELKGNELKVRAVPPTLPGNLASVEPSRAQMDYTVTLDENTEISRNIPSGDPSNPPKPEKLALSDLKKELQVIVYTDVDVLTTTKVKALRIEPLMPLSATPIPITPTPTGAATPLPSPQEP